MGYLCEYCGEQRSMVYCQSDAASLCLSCDRIIHSANALSKRHSRTLICERCNSQPAFVRCVEEKISLCRNCDWMGHSGSNVNTAHKRQAVNCYSGCPSASELSANWSFLLDHPSVGDSACEQGINLMSINDKTTSNCENVEGNNNTQDLGDTRNVDVDKSTDWMDSLTPLRNVDCPAGSTSTSVPKVFSSGAKGPAVCEDDGVYDDLYVDEVDLSLENYEELFGVAFDNPDNFGYDGIDEIFGTKDMSESNCHGAYAAEGSSFGGANGMQPACSNAESADSFASCKTEPILRFSRQLQPALSFSGMTGEIGGGDYQDCGVSSSMAITGDPPWYPPPPDISLPSTSRTDAVLRYKEKKKARKFDKKVRYESRKARADVRRRVKGRFVKAGEAYDYDPLSPCRSY